MSEARVVKRNETVADIILQLKEPIVKVFVDLWAKTYKNEKLPQNKWLCEFQLSLKNVKGMSDDDITDRLMHKKRLLANVHQAVMLTANLYHDGAEPRLLKERPLLIKFAREALVQVARELWAKPYIMFKLTHRKQEVEQSRETLEKLISTTIKYQVRQFTDDIMLMEQERIEKCKELVDLGADSSGSDSDDDSDSEADDIPIRRHHSSTSAPSSILSEAAVATHAQRYASPAPSHQAGSRAPSVASLPMSAKSATSFEEFVPEIPPQSPQRHMSFDQAPSSPYPSTYDTSKTIDILSPAQGRYFKSASLPASPRSAAEIPLNSSSLNTIDHMDYIPVKKEGDAMSLRSASSSIHRRSSKDFKSINIKGDMLKIPHSLSSSSGSSS